MLMFAEVANCQSFTLAAKHLGMSKSAVSQQIKRLEQHLGQQLLSRHTRGMSLTAAGRKLLLRCELLQDQANIALEELASVKETPSGVFALTIPHSCERNIVIPALNQLCIEFLRLEPKLVVSDAALDLIQENMDVAIYGGGLKDSSYRALSIGTATDILCATPAYVSKRCPIKKLEHLLDQKFIPAPWQKNPLVIYCDNARTGKIVLNIDFYAYTNTLTCAIEMVLNDMGIALLPEFAVQSALSDGKLIRVLPSHQGPEWPFYLVHRFQSDRPIHVTRFYQLVRHFFSKATAVSYEG